MMTDDATRGVHRQRTQRLKFFLLTCLSGLLGLGLAFGLPQSIRLQWYIEWGPAWALFSLLLLLIAAIIYGVRAFRSADRVEQRSLLLDLAFSAALVVFLCLWVPARALIENDENNIQSAAQGIHLHFQSTSVGSGIIDQHGVVTPESLKLDKRGVMFPLMLNALAPHWMSFDQARYWVNGFWGWWCLLLTIRLGRLFGLQHGAWGAALLLASFPVFTVTLRSGLFDVANLGLLLLMALMGLRCLRARSSQEANSAALLMATAAVVVCQIRYEAVLPACIMLGVLILRGSCQTSAPRAPALVLAPLLIAPGLLRMAMPIDYEMPGPWFKPWSVMNIPDNLEQLLAWIFSPHGMGTGNPIVGVLLVVGVLLYGLRRQWRLAAGWTTLFLALPLLALTAVLMYSYWGKAGMAITVRYFLYLTVVLAICAMYLCWNEVRHLRGLRHTPLIVGMAILAFRLPASVNAEPFTGLTLHRYRDAALQNIHTAYGNCQVLIVAYNGAFFMSSGISALPLARFAKQSGDYIRHARAYRHAAVALSIEAPQQGPVPQSLLDRVGAVTRVASATNGHTQAHLYQIWPPGTAPTQDCVQRGLMPSALYIDPAHPPRKPWEGFVQRWSPQDPAHRILMEPDSP